MIRRPPRSTLFPTRRSSDLDQVTAVEIGDRITISNLPPWVAPGDVDLHVQGYTETVGLYDWTIVFNCTPAGPRSEEHTSELQSQFHLVCRLLLEKKNAT